MKRVMRVGVLVGLVVIMDDMLSRMYADDPRTWKRACNNRNLVR